jgi:succinate dehydrogenase / fumarate reductase cytochrome b subunit
VEPAPLPAAQPPGFFARNQFLIYRLFSLAGLLPIGGYLCIHLVFNATVIDSPAMFQRQVDTIHSLRGFLWIVEWTFIFLPLLFHAVVGWLILSGATPNLSSYSYSGNVRYMLQRVTGIIAFFFILAHVLHLHHLGSLVDGGASGLTGQFEPARAASSAGRAIQAAVWIQVAYAIGVLACAYHFGNGIWTFGITWGIWVTPKAQRGANYLAAAAGVLVAVVGLSALVGMSRVDVDEAQQVEKRMERAKKAAAGEEVAGGAKP